MTRKLIIALIVLLSSSSGQAQLFMLKDIISGTESSFPNRFFKFKNLLYFTTNNSEIWRTNGKRNGTEKFISLGVNYTFFAAGQNLFYFTNNDNTNGVELWRSDGTEDGTFLLKDIKTGNAPNDPRSLVVLNDTAYFISYDDALGYQVFQSDGSKTGTKRITNLEYENLAYGPMNLNVVGNRIILVSISKTTPFTSDIYFFNRSTQSFDLFKTFINTNNFFYIPSQFTELNNHLYFVAEKDSSTHIWKSDYTSSGTQILKKINSSNFNSTISLKTVFDSHLFFTVFTQKYGYEIWKTDGTESGTVIMSDIVPGASSSSPNFLSVFKNRLYFVYFNSFSFELAYFNNANDSIQVKLNYKSGSNAVSFSTVYYTDNFIYFFATDQLNRGGLYRSDGESIEFIDKVFSSNSFVGIPFELIEYKNDMYFGASSTENGEELWRTRLFAPESQNFTFNHFLYPNPASSKIYILPRAIDYINNTYSVNIVDHTGKTVLQYLNQTPDQTELDVSSLSDGLYTVILTSSNGTVLREQMVIL